ncbi:hypothetical protein M9Y10_000227 [Tritrichomonas musculus]|uniref:Uncharacterized protein n=1 Tax=Tritrichomonas musculus TaxID=1915356 RepID=A0ABR2L3Q5_9EUKA
MMLFDVRNRYSESAFDADLFNTSPDEFEEYFQNYQNMPTKMSAWRHETWDTYKSKVALKDSTILKPQSKDDLSYSHEISKFEIFREDSPLKYVNFKNPERKLPQSSPRTEVANECFIDQNRLRHPPVGPQTYFLIVLNTLKIIFSTIIQVQNLMLYVIQMRVDRKRIG